MDQDPFDTLGISPAFNLDSEALEHAYLRLAAKLHPDLAAADPDAHHKSAQLNDAKRVLDDPELRAQALLTRLQGPGLQDDRTLPDGLLMEVMEVRQAAEQARRNDDLKEMQKWVAWAQERRDHHIQSVSTQFAQLADPPDLAALQAIRVELNAWRYIERMIEQLDPEYDPLKAETAGEK